MFMGKFVFSFSPRFPLRLTTSNFSVVTARVKLDLTNNPWDGACYRNDAGNQNHDVPKFLALELGVPVAGEGRVQAFGAKHQLRNAKVVSEEAHNISFNPQDMDAAIFKYEVINRREDTNTRDPKNEDEAERTEDTKGVDRINKQFSETI